MAPCLHWGAFSCGHLDLSLQDEANIGLNAVPSIEAFVSDINHGKWDKVLAQVWGRLRVVVAVGRPAPSTVRRCSGGGGGGVGAMAGVCVSFSFLFV